MNVPELTQFHLDFPGNGLVHLVFDCPGRTMNVLSNAAIEELDLFSRWLPDADIKGVLIRSGKDNGFCVGADLAELGAAYDMIMAAPQHARFNLAFDHFFRLSSAIRRLETAGKPIAAAIAGLALGGGCELAMGAHFRVLGDDPRIGMGLPESLVGLLPGGGGTQRVTRLVGLEAGLHMLLDGGRLGQSEAVGSGLVHMLAPPGEEVARAEAWLLRAPDVSQPWDRTDWKPIPAAAVSAAIEPIRQRVLKETLGHYPAHLAILDCVEFGLPQCFDGAIRTEMAIFGHLIQREEPRNMIQTLFLAKTQYERLAKQQALPKFVHDAVAAARSALEAAGTDHPALMAAGWRRDDDLPLPVRARATPGYWIDGSDAESAAARSVFERISTALAPMAGNRSAEELRLADYAIVKETGYPPYLGGPFAFAGRRR